MVSQREDDSDVNQSSVMHPAMRELLESRAAERPAKTFAELGIVAARELSAASARTLRPGPAMKEVKDLDFDGPVGRLHARLYIPDDDLLSCIVFYHGGGWVMGSIAGYDPACRRLAQGSSSAVLSIDYRLAPEHPYPAPFQDCYAALAWASEHHSALFGRRLPLIVAGDSAGGNLAAAVALAARDRSGPKIAMQLLMFPATDADFSRASYRQHATGALLTTDAMKWFWDQYAPRLQLRTEPTACPMQTLNLKGLPPAQIELAAYDPLFDEGEAYAFKLSDDGVAVRCRVWENLCHGFFQLESLVPPAADAVDKIAADVQTFLRDSVTPWA